MMQMESGNGPQCWLPASNNNVSRGEVKVQYSTNQTMYNAPCSVYNVPTITLPQNPSQTITLPQNPSQTYILQDTSQLQQQNFQVQTSTVKEEALKCRHWPSCKFYTSNPQSLKNHELTHYAQQSLYTCNDCNIHFTNKASKDEHIRRKHKTWAKVYSCSHCNFETSVLDEFSEHNVAFHLDTGSSGQIYQCHQCTYSTSWKCFLDSHLLIHSMDDYRLNKKPRYDNKEEKKGDVVSSPVAGNSPAKSFTGDSPVAPLQAGSSTPPLSSTESITPVYSSAAVSTAVPFSTRHEPSSAPLNSVAYTGHSAALGAQVTYSTPRTSYNNFSFSGEKEHRCNMCHGFTTTCPETLQAHIKSHNTCAQCGYSSNSISDLSLHVCNAYEVASPYSAPPLMSNDQPDNNISYSQPNYVSQQLQPAQIQSVPQLQQLVQQQPPQQPQPPPPAPAQCSKAKKRGNSNRVEEEFQPGIYRCGKCNYGTSWKCFLDSHMLTHGANI